LNVPSEIPPISLSNMMHGQSTKFHECILLSETKCVASAWRWSKWQTCCH